MIQALNPNPKEKSLQQNPKPPMIQALNPKPKEKNLQQNQNLT